MRREISDLMNNYPDQWNLYMLALDDLHHANQSDPYSFYGLACTWDNRHMRMCAKNTMQQFTEDPIEHGATRQAYHTRLAKRATARTTTSCSWDGIVHT